MGCRACAPLVPSWLRIQTASPNSGKISTKNGKNSAIPTSGRFRTHVTTLSTTIPLSAAVAMTNATKQTRAAAVESTGRGRYWYVGVLTPVGPARRPPKTATPAAVSSTTGPVPSPAEVTNPQRGPVATSAVHGTRTRSSSDNSIHRPPYPTRHATILHLPRSHLRHEWSTRQQSRYPSGSSPASLGTSALHPHKIRRPVPRTAAAISLPRCACQPVQPGDNGHVGSGDQSQGGAKPIGARGQPGAGRHRRAAR